jgi:hypothetical protein
VQKPVGFVLEKRSTLEGRAVIGRYCSSLLRRPPAGKTCLSLTSRAVSSKATEAPFTTRVCPDFAGASDEVTHDETPRHTPTRVRFATPYLEIESHSTSALERTIKRELAQDSHIANSNQRKRRDQSSPVRTRLACPP